MTSEFPERLRRLRELERMDRKKLGECCGLSKNAIGKYERGGGGDLPNSHARGDLRGLVTDTEETASMERAARMCPVCGSESVVFRSMEKADGTIVRKRICKVCETKFETQEKFLRVLYMARQK